MEALEADNFLPKVLSIVISLLTTSCVIVVASIVFPARRSNPEAHAPLRASDDVMGILRRACFDCHSNETRWPWYSALAPVSWLVAHDVATGRRELNFSEWYSYLPEVRRRKLLWIGRAVGDGTMPPRLYQLVHRGSRLTKAQRSLILRWLKDELNKLDCRSERLDSASRSLVARLDLHPEVGR